ncbi:hypothetical protein H0H93_008961 [Arthromyces matolae]|nr:hypothetical protein H0H93_008961 [Arthromyces matolae]
MPPSPGLYTPHHRGVGRVPLQILGWTVEEEFLIRWMEKFAPRSDLKDSDEKQQWAHFQIPHKLPRGYHKYATVWDPTPEYPTRRGFCYCITSNKNADELKLADNMEIVDGFRIALDVQTPPRWSTDATTSAPSEQIELLPIEMPRSPGLYTPNRRGPGSVRMKVLGWTVDEEFLNRWMEKFAPNPEANTRNMKRQWAHQQIEDRLPADHCGYATVRDLIQIPGQPTIRKWCYCFTSNRTKKELKLANNTEIVDAFRIVLGVQTAPQWYTVSD